MNYLVLHCLALLDIDEVGEKNPVHPFILGILILTNPFFQPVHGSEKLTFGRPGT